MSDSGRSDMVKRAFRRQEDQPCYVLGVDDRELDEDALRLALRDAVSRFRREMDMHSATVRTMRALASGGRR